VRSLCQSLFNLGNLFNLLTPDVSLLSARLFFCETLFFLLVFVYRTRLLKLQLSYQLCQLNQTHTHTK